MSHATDIDELKQAISELYKTGASEKLADQLATSANNLRQQLTDACLKHVEEYSDSANPDVIPELKQHLEASLGMLTQLLKQSRTINLDFVIGHAHLKASQRFPLHAILQTYRRKQRLLTDSMSRMAVDTAAKDAHVHRIVAAMTDVLIHYTGTISSLATQTYIEQTRTLAEADGDRRRRLFDTLIGGFDESDSQAASLLRRAGYLQQRQSYCVVVARSINPQEMDSSARAQRMADAISDVFTQSPLRLIVGIRDKQVVAIVSGSRRMSGWTAPQSLLADRIHKRLLKIGPAAIIGVSNDAPSTAHIPRALNEAQLALDYAAVDKRVMHFSDIPLRQMLVVTASKTLRDALPAWAGLLFAADNKARGKLSTTLRAYAKHNMNAIQTAEALNIHANTIYARMQKIQSITNLNPLSFHDLSEMLLALDCRDVV